MNLFQHLHWRHYLKYGVMASLFYCVAVAFFCRDATFTETWLLFAGNLLFLFTISFSLFSFNKQRQGDASTVSMLAGGMITTFTGILISSVVCLTILVIYVPGLLHAGTPSNILTDEPANTIRGKTNGMAFMIFMSAIMGNFVAGFAASIIFSFILKSNQTKEEESAELSDL